MHGIRLCVFSALLVQVYRNIRLTSLAALLGIDAAKTERIAAKMVTEARLNGSIDQVAGVLDFAGEAGGGAGAGAGAGSGGGGSAAAAAGGVAPEVATLLAWDSSIKVACTAVNGLVEAIGRAHPDLVGK